MTTEKKKRTPKPERTPAISGIVAAVPFLNASDNPAELTRLADVARQPPEGATSRLFQPDRRDLVDHLRETRDLCREMLWVALWGEDTQKEEAAITARNKHIEAVLNASTFEVYWRNRNHTTMVHFLIEHDPRKKMTPEDHVKAFRARLVRGIVEAFDSEAGRPGAAYVGVCPRCGKVFEKRQANAVFCSRYCQSEGSRKK